MSILSRFSNKSLTSTALIALVSLYFTVILNYPFYRQVLTIHPYTGTPLDYFLLTVPLFVFFVLNGCFQIIALSPLLS